HLDLLDVLGGNGPVLAPDLRGQGESPHAAPDVALWSRQVLGILDAIALPRVKIVAIGASAAAAVELAMAHPDRVASIVLQSPPVLDPGARAAMAAGYAVSAVPEWDGSHLTRVYHHLRDQQLWWPWFARTAANARRHDLRIDPHDLTLQVRECVK